MIYFFASFYLEAASRISTFQLGNGLKVILAPVENVEAACVMLYHLTGVRDDPPEIRGASSLYQTLMLSETQNLEALDRVMFTKKFGGSSSIRINYDNSIFCQMVPETELNEALWFESERISSLRLQDQNIENLKNYMQNRLERMSQSNIHFRAGNWIKSKVFEGTIYQTPIYGDPEKITDFDSQKIKKIYDNFRNLSDIIMVISGKFDANAIKDSIYKRFAGLSFAKKTGKKKYTKVSPRSEYVYRNWTIDKLQQQFIMYGIRAPAMNSFDYLYFDFIRYYLLDNRISKLERQLIRNDLDVALSHEFTDNIEANALIIEISAEKRIDLEKAKIILNKELSALTTKLLSGSEMRLVRELMEIDLKKNMQDLKLRSFLLAHYYHLALYNNIDFSREYLNRLRRITTHDIIRVSKTYLKKENLVVLNVYGK